MKGLCIQTHMFFSPSLKPGSPTDQSTSLQHPPRACSCSAPQGFLAGTCREDSLSLLCTSSRQMLPFPGPPQIIEPFKDPFFNLNETQVT